MTQNKIIDIYIKSSHEDKCPVPHLVSLTYDDHTKMEINMNGEQVANVLSKAYVGLKECVDLTLSGSSNSGFIFKANGGTYRGTLNKEHVLTLFNESDYVKAIIQEHTLMDTRKNDSQTNDAKSSTANMSNVLESFTNAQGNNKQKKKYSKSYRPENSPTLGEMHHLNRA